MFMVKDFASITASMINRMKLTARKLTDYSVGSTARTLIEAPATEMDQLYQEMFIGLREAIPAATYYSFGFDRIPARASTTTVTFTLDGETEVYVPSGTRLSNTYNASIFATIDDVTVPPGVTSASIAVAATIAGKLGNVPSNTITGLTDPISGILSVTNPFTVYNGRDEETDEERRIRFGTFVQNLARTTNAGLYYGAMSTVIYDDNGSVRESVREASIVEPYLRDRTGEIARSEIYIHNGSGGTSQALVAETQRVVDGYRRADGEPVYGFKAAGVRAFVYAAAEQFVNVTGRIVLTDSTWSSSTVILQATTAINDYLIDLSVGADVIEAELVDRVMNIDGVYDVQFSLPSGNLAIDDTQKAMPGTLSLTTTVTTS